MFYVKKVCFALDFSFAEKKNPFQQHPLICDCYFKQSLVEMPFVPPSCITAD